MERDNNGSKDKLKVKKLKKPIPNHNPKSGKISSAPPFLASAPASNMRPYENSGIPISFNRNASTGKPTLFDRKWFSILKSLAHLSSGGGDREIMLSFLEKTGDVSRVMDRGAAKTIFKISGPIPANNYVRVPSNAMPVSTWQKLGTNMPFLYLALKPISNGAKGGGPVFVIHLELALADGFNFRVSISSLFSRLKLDTHSVGIPFKASSVLKWCMLELDLGQLARDFAQREYRFLRGIQICSNVFWKDGYMSEGRMEREKLPRDMAFPTFVEGIWDDHYDWMQLRYGSNVKDDDNNNIGDVNGMMDQVYFIKDRVAMKVNQNAVAKSMRKMSFTRPISEVPVVESKDEPDNISSALIIAEPLLELSKINGSFLKGSRNFCLINVHSKPQLLVLPVQNMIVTMIVSDNNFERQNFLIGHSNSIVDLVTSPNGKLIASCQKSPSLIRIWSVESGSCVALIEGPAEPKFLSFSIDSNILLVIGREYQNRHIMLFWNVSKASLTLSNQGSSLASLVNQHISDAPLENVAWSPFEASQFITCGDNYAKLWKFEPNELLRSFSVKFPSGSRPFIQHVAFVYHEMKPVILLGSKAGTIYRVNSTSLQVEGSFNYNSPITCIQPLSSKVDEQYILVAHADGNVFAYENAKFDKVKYKRDFGPDDWVIGAAAVEDSSKESFGDPLVITENGTIYKLNLREYNDPEIITWTRKSSLLCQSFLNGEEESYFAAVYKDSALAIWNSSLQEVNHLSSQKETISCLAFYPDEKYLILGTGRGTIQCYSIRGGLSKMCFPEITVHNGPVHEIAFHHTGKFGLCAGESDTRLVSIKPVFEFGSGANVLAGFTITKTAFGDWQGFFRNVSLVMNSSGSCFIAALQTKIADKVSIFDSETLDLLHRIDLEPSSPSSHICSRVIFMGQCPCFQNQLVILSKSGYLWTIQPGADGDLSWKIDKSISLHSQLFNASGGNGSKSSVGVSKGLDVFELSAARFAGSYLFFCFKRNGSIFPNLHVIAFDESFKGHSTRQSYLSLHDSVLDIQVDERRLKLILIMKNGLFSVWSIKSSSLTSQGFMNRLKSSVKEESAPVGTKIPLGRTLAELRGGHDSAAGSIEALQASLNTLAMDLKASLPLVHYNVPNRPGHENIVEDLYLPMPKDSILELAQVLGFSANIFKSMTWLISSGLLVYISESILVLEDLSSRRQKFLVPTAIGSRRNSKISAFHVQNSERYLICAHIPNHFAYDGGNNDMHCGDSMICLWNIEEATCERVFYHTDGVVQALRYSPDDRLALSLGNYGNSCIRVWDPAIGQLLTSIELIEYPLNDVAWDPMAPNEFVTAGEGGKLSFWLLHEGIEDPSQAIYKDLDEEGANAKNTSHAHDNKVFSLKEQVAKFPDDSNFNSANTCFTSIVYKNAPSSLLFAASSKGLVSVWDSRDNNCLFSFNAEDNGEIGKKTY